MIETTYWAIKDEAFQSLKIAAKVQREPSAENRKLIAARLAAGGSAHSVSGAVGVLNIVGVLSKTEEDALWYGGTSFENLNASLSSLLADPSVAVIVLNVDSPGGEVNGTNEFAARIAESTKLVIACVDGMACSAAYWIASQAPIVMTQETSELGSIGIVATYVDASGWYEKIGLKVHQIVSSQSPMKRPDLGTEEGMAEVRKTIDSLASIFVGKVSKGRGVTEEVVLEEFGRGGVLVGVEAIRAKMADGLSTLRDVLGLTGGRMEIVSQTPVAVAAAAPVEAVAPVQSDTDAAAFQKGVAAGVEQERARIRAIDDLGPMSSFESIVSEAKYGANPKDAAGVLLAVHEESRKRKEALRSDVVADAAQLPVDLRTSEAEPSEREALVGGLIDAMKTASNTTVGGQR